MSRTTSVFLAFIFFCISATGKKSLYSNTWVVQVHGGAEEANRLARMHGFVNLGQVGSLADFYTFRHDSHPRRSRRHAEERSLRLAENPSVIWASQQVIKKRVKRDVNIRYNDPLYPKQWFLHNTNDIFKAYDHNVLPVWKQGITGKGIVVSILDDGIEYVHEDLKDNYDAEASYDYNSNDADPKPRPTWNDENRHGTRCAGEVAAKGNNSVCGVGIAPGARIGGVRMLDGDVTDAVEASSLSLHPQHIEIYSASWGPDDDGGTVDGPAILAKKAFSDGIKNGRGGLGSIYVWASGNGGRARDSCNCDGYTNSIYTLSISSATEHGTVPWYLESCSSTLATTFSSGTFSMKQVVTTDLHGKCTETHTGTSASAPLAAGILALALEVNRNLTWRDMQHLVVMTSKTDKLHTDDFAVNGVGRHVSHRFGYGLLDAAALVEMAKGWKTVPDQHICQGPTDTQSKHIKGGAPLVVKLNTTGCKGSSNDVRYLEHVEAVLSLSFTRRGDLQIYLTSPRGTRTCLLGSRPRDRATSGFKNWAFMSTHTWGEDPQGIWTLEIENTGSSANQGSLDSWSLVFYGTSEKPHAEATHKNAVVACSIECKGGCRGPNTNQCNECKNFMRASTQECVSSCSSKEFVDGSKVCHACSSTCGSCGNSATNCLSCLPPLILKEGRCINNCPDGWFKHTASNAQPVCEKCSGACKTCAGEASRCLSCPESYKLQEGVCVKYCEVGKFLRDGNCLPCDPSCSGCSSAADQCSSCAPNYHWHRSKCVSQCPTGTFLDTNNRCSLCHSSCETCYGGSESHCLSCAGQLVMLHSKCVSSCPQDMFHNHTSHQCQHCHPTCATCGQSSDHCASCRAGWTLDGSHCHSQCKTGEFWSGTTCTKCAASCLECSGPSDGDCISCKESYFLETLSNHCVPECPNGFYGDLQTTQCKACGLGCRQCSSDNVCLACLPGSVLSGNTCVVHCSAGTYQTKDAKCEPCSESCLECETSPSKCTKCRVDHTLNDGQCSSICPKGAFMNRDSKECFECHPHCAECTGPSAGECTKCEASAKKVGSSCVTPCPAGSYYDSNVHLCQPCNYFCQTCVGGSGLHNCTLCIPPMILLDHYCVAQCPRNWVLNSKQQKCERCHPSCRTCTGTTANDCLSCTDSQMSLDGSTCRAECPEGQFQQQNTGRCAECHPTCKTCSGPGPLACTSCVDGLVEFPGNNTCQSVCPVGKFSAGGGCIDCHSSCKTCNSGGQDNCLSCPENYFHFHGNCVSNCPQGTYPNKSPDTSGHCAKCHPVCQSCSGSSSSNCTKCKAPFYLENSTCVPQCSKGFATQKGSKTCTPCGKGCKASQNRFRHRSVQDPSRETLGFMLKDPKESGLLTMVIVGVVAALFAFFAIFGILQMRSTKMLCWGRRYTILKANFGRCDEEVHLMGQDKEEQEECA